MESGCNDIKQGPANKSICRGLLRALFCCLQWKKARMPFAFTDFLCHLSTQRGPCQLEYWQNNMSSVTNVQSCIYFIYNELVVTLILFVLETFLNISPSLFTQNGSVYLLSLQNANFLSFTFLFYVWIFRQSILREFYVQFVEEDMDFRKYSISLLANNWIYMNFFLSVFIIIVSFCPSKQLSCRSFLTYGNSHKYH